MSVDDWHDCIKCPKCGHENHERTDYPESLDRDGDGADYECVECEHEFRVILCVTYEYGVYTP